jgi:fermentation-respiration switch protein FrsA (DUF1100 family)
MAVDPFCYRRRLKRMLTVLAAVVFAFGIVVLLIYALQDRLVYFPTRELETTPRALGVDYEDVWLTTEDGVRLHGWFVATPAARATVLFFHGNGGNISHRLERIMIFRQLCLNVLLFDYRGYGRSDGEPSEQGTYRDARAAWRYLTETRGLSPSTIILYGESLGGAVATHLAAGQTPRAVVVESSFSSAIDLGAEVYPWLPVRWISRYVYPSAQNLEHIQAPVLIIHSRDDEIVPFRHGQVLFAAAHEPKELLEIHGGHNDGPLMSGTQYRRGLEGFFGRVFERR